MKSRKRRRAEFIAARANPIEKERTPAKVRDQRLRPVLGPPVNEGLLAPNNSYGEPEFVRRGYYVDLSFRCIDCGKEEIWSGGQQKWWYEVAKGFAYSTAVRCRMCRRKKRERSAEARRIHLEGIEHKKRLKGKNR